VEFWNPLSLAILAAGFAMAWNLGANDLANAMATSVGSRALRIWQATLVAAVLNLVGAAFYGARVTHTVAQGIVPIELIDQHMLALGALAVLLAAATFLILATHWSLPVSTTHAIVGAMMGFGVVAVGPGQVAWGVLGQIVASWLISPLIGGLVAFFIYSIFRHLILARVSDAGLPQVERFFALLQIISASYVAFAHGSNDVANAIAPLAAVFGFVGRTTPTWLLLFGGAGIAIGTGTWGYRVMRTVGQEITRITPVSGFSAELSAASSILVFSSLGLPISTTHTVVGAVIGIGLASGIEALNLRTIRNIFLSWLFTVPAAAGLAALLFLLFRGAGL